MSIGLILACLWFVAANVGAMLPSRDYHWRFAYVLIALGVPVLGLSLIHISEPTRPY